MWEENNIFKDQCIGNTSGSIQILWLYRMVKGNRSSLLGISLSQSEILSTHSPQMVWSLVWPGCYGNVPVNSPEITNTFPAVTYSILHNRRVHFHLLWPCTLLQSHWSWSIWLLSHWTLFLFTRRNCAWFDSDRTGSWLMSEETKQS
jgi:hypothetical protein